MAVSREHRAETWPASAHDRLLRTRSGLSASRVTNVCLRSCQLISDAADVGRRPSKLSSIRRSAGSNRRYASAAFGRCQLDRTESAREEVAVASHVGEEAGKPKRQRGTRPTRQRDSTARPGFGLRFGTVRIPLSITPPFQTRSGPRDEGHESRRAQPRIESEDKSGKQGGSRLFRAS